MISGKCYGVYWYLINSIARIDENTCGIIKIALCYVPFPKGILL